MSNDTAKHELKSSALTMDILREQIESDNRLLEIVKLRVKSNKEYLKAEINNWRRIKRSLNKYS